MTQPANLTPITADQVTARHALTLWQPWASLVAMGLKPYEFRRWPAYDNFIGKRIVIHAAARKPKGAELAELITNPSRLEGSIAGSDEQLSAALAFLTRVWCEEETLVFSAGLAEATLGAPVRCIDLFRATMDPDEINPDMWAWPMSDVTPITPPYPARGAQSFWRWPDGAAMKYREPRKAAKESEPTKAAGPDPQGRLL